MRAPEHVVLQGKFHWKLLLFLTAKNPFNNKAAKKFAQRTATQAIQITYYKKFSVDVISWNALQAISKVIIR